MLSMTMSAKIIQICNKCREKYGQKSQEFTVDGICEKCHEQVKVSYADAHELTEK